MKKFNVALWAGVLAIALAGRAESMSFEGVKIGGGLLWNESTVSSLTKTSGQLHLALSIKPVEFMSVEPYYEVASLDGAAHKAGANLIYTLLEGQSHHIFFGPGIGFSHINGNRDLNWNVKLGYERPFNERMGIFVQTQYSGTEAQRLDGISGHIGLRFSPF